MKAEIQWVCTQLFTATANGVYQGIILAFLVGLGLRLLRRTNAATRHGIWFGTLLLLVLAIPAHYWMQLCSRHSRESTAWVALSGSFAPDARLHRAELLPSPPHSSWSDLVDNADTAGAGVLLDSGTPASLPAVAGRGSAPDDEPTGSVSPYRRRWQRLLDGVLQPVSWNLESAPRLRVLAGFLVLWLGIALIRLMRLGLKLVQLRRLPEGATPPEPELAALFNRLQEEEQGHRKAELRISGQQRGPLVLGFGRPLILLPADFAAQSSLLEAEHVLRHELAHLRRYDDWANLVQHLVQAVLFFHPAVWWIGKELTLQREIACDDHVLKHAAGPRSYALTLASVAGRVRPPAPLLAPGVSSSKSQLQQRINMILNTRRNSAPGLSKARLLSVLSATSLVALVALSLGPRLGLAQAVAVSPPTPASSAAAVAPAAVAIAPVAAEPSPPGAVVVATSEDAVAPTPAIEPGPKFKPENPGQEASEIAEPAPPGGPDVPVMPRRPRVVRMPKPPKAAPSADSLEENPDGNLSVEARLRRVEKMVQALLAQQNNKRPHAYVYLNDANQNLNMDQKALEKLKQSAERQAERAAEQAERAQEQSKRMADEFRRDHDLQSQGHFREALQKQLEALRKARENLDQEMERLSRQIEKLERARDRGDRGEQLQPGELPGAKMQAQGDSAPEAAK